MEFKKELYLYKYNYYNKKTSLYFLTVKTLKIILINLWRIQNTKFLFNFNFIILRKNYIDIEPLRNQKFWGKKFHHLFGCNQINKKQNSTRKIKDQLLK